MRLVDFKDSFVLNHIDQNQKFDNDKTKSNKTKKSKSLFSKVKQAFNKLVSVKG